MLLKTGFLEWVFAAEQQLTKVGRLPIGVNLSDEQRLARTHHPERRGVALVSSDRSDVGADRPYAGIASNKMRRPGTERRLNTLGLKTSPGRSKRTGSRSSIRVLAHLVIIPFLGPRTEPF